MRLAFTADLHWGARQRGDDATQALAAKRFTRGRHNDANFVHWPLDDVRFTREVVTTLEQHLSLALGQVSRTLVVTHHPPFYGLGFDRGGPPATLDSFLWDALLGNR